MTKVSLIAALALWPIVLGGGRADATGTRVEVPIRQTVLSNNDIRYSVPVAVGTGTPFDAALDTGSFGLRVLTGALDASQYVSTGLERDYPYASGARLRGFLARAPVAIGGASTSDAIPFQVVRSVDCAPNKPRCPVSKVSADDYRIAGDGLPREGFRAILGISLRRAPAEVGANNPLMSMSSGRWIVDLPRPGDPQPGRLVISPDDSETAGFTLFQLERQPAQGDAEAGTAGWLDGRLPGCLAGGEAGRLCASTVLDSGAIGITVTSADAKARSHWRPGTAATLEFSDGADALAAPFRVGENQASSVEVLPARGEARDRIMAGALPFYAFDVLYDDVNGMIGLRPRADVAR